MEGNAEKTHEHTADCTHAHCTEPKRTLVVAKLQFEDFEHKAWRFYHSKYPMFDTKQLDQVSDTVGTMGMPEVFYGFNHLYIINPQKDILLEFSAVDALSLSAFAKQREHLKNGSTLESDFDKKVGVGSAKDSSAAVSEEKQLNQIDLMPARIEVKDSTLWKKKDMSKVKDFKQIEVISDWTYSTPYKGTVLRLSSASKRVFLETSLQFPCLVASAGVQLPKQPISVQPSTTELPLHRLGRENPIIHWGEVYLYEDDLGDQGYCCCQLRFRVMGDCFYVLHRYYLRVDQVLVRIFDTRIFHSFDENVILREFQHKESSFDELRQKGFNLSSDWSLSKTQADEVFPQLGLKTKVLDQIVLSDN